MPRQLAIVILATILVSTSLVHAKVYKWVTKDGTVVYSDQPHPNAEILDIEPLHPYKAPTSKYAPSDDEAETGTSATATNRYSSVSISSPQHQQTITGNAGSFSVSVTSNPNLIRGDKFQLLLNGSEIGETSAQAQFNLDNVNRGSHNISVKIIDKNGQIQGTSAAITIHVKRISVKKLRPSAR